MADESELTVLTAGGANLAIAIAKGVAGLLSGSSALMAEAAHSVADTLNQAFLLTALRRSRKPPDARHPFGYGPERYFWSLLAAVGIFVLGAGFSVAEGVRAIVHPEPLASLKIVYAVLLVSCLFEGTSWLRAVRQLRREAAGSGRRPIEHVRGTAEPAAKTVAFEDTAALIGILLAGAGVTVGHVTGWPYADGLASILIGCLLVVVAWSLGKENKAMLIGQALPTDDQARIHDTIESVPGIDAVVDLRTVRLSPQDVLVVAAVDLDDGLSSEEVERLGDAVDGVVRARHPDVRHLFLDPTAAAAARPGSGRPTRTPSA